MPAAWSRSRAIRARKLILGMTGGLLPETFASNTCSCNSVCPPRNSRNWTISRAINRTPSRRTTTGRLTPAEFKQRFSLAPEDTEAITAWLQSAGFTVEVINPQSIVFSGTAGQVRNAFRTEIHNLDVNGEKHIANMTDPQIPAALAPAVVASSR